MHSALPAITCWPKISPRQGMRGPRCFSRTYGFGTSSVLTSLQYRVGANGDECAFTFRVLGRILIMLYHS